MKLHEKIRRARKAKDWSQEETAKKLNLSLNAYGCIERGETHPNSIRLEQLARVFEMELAELVSDRIFLISGKLIVIIVRIGTTVLLLNKCYSYNMNWKKCV